MTRVALGPLVMLLVASSCFGGSPQGASEELNELAMRAQHATYDAIYHFAITGTLAPSETTRAEIVQDPPLTLRKVETVTQSKDGKRVSLREWQVHNADGDFACTDYAGIGVRCLKNPIARGTFGRVQLDEFFDTPRGEGTFASVRKATRPARIAGEQGTCFEAVPVAATQPPISSPQAAATPDRFRFELCYAEDGILLRGRRTVLEGAEEGSQREALIEAISVSRVVEPRDLRLPGPLGDPGDLR